jgi:hypothetical protein
VAISIFSLFFEIASVVSLPRNDITTHSQQGRGEISNIFGWIFELGSFKFTWNLIFEL